MRYALRCTRRAVAFLVAAVFVAACTPDTPESLVASAREYMAKHDHNAAAIQLRNALQKQPKSAEARFLLGTALLESGDPVGAEIELRKAIDYGLPAAEANPALARSFLMRGQSHVVVNYYANAEAATSDGMADLQATVGRAYLALGDMTAAERAFGRALAASPSNASALVATAYLALVRNDTTRALELVDAALKSDPRRLEAYQLKGELLAGSGDVEGAMAAHRRALEIAPNFIPAHASVVMLLLRERRFEEAGKQLDALAAIAPKHAETSYLRALSSYQQKDLQAARQSVQQHLAAAPQSARGLLLAATIEQELRSYDRAEAYLHEALKVSPNLPGGRQMLVAIYLQSGQKVRALQALPAMLESSGGNAAALKLAGDVYLANGRAQDATRYFEKVAAADPQDAPARLSLAMSRIAQGDTESALRELEEAAAKGSDARADVALIMTLVRKREFDKAMSAVDALEKKRPKEALPHHMRGVVLLARKDPEAARKSFERAAAADPAYFPAALSLARLDLLQKKPQDAKKRFDPILAKDPQNVQALLARAEVERAAGGSAEAVGSLIAKAVAAKPGDVTARVALIYHHLRAKDEKRAVAAAQEALAAIPDRPELLEAAGRAHAAAGATNQAIADYTRWTQLQPTSPLPFTRLGELQVTSKDYAGAERNLKKALDLRPGYVEAQRALVALEMARDRMQEAIAIARIVQKQRPKQSIGYLLEGDIHAAKKAWKPASAAYAAGLKQAPSDDLAIKAHAALRLAGQQGDADKLAADWLKSRPDDRSFRVYLAESMLSERNYAAAAEQYRALLAHDADNVVWLNNLAWIYARLKDPKAVEYAERAAKLAPDNGAVLDTLGALLVESGEVGRGLPLLKRAVQLAPERHAIRLNLAEALIKSGDKEGARRELDVLAALGDKFPGQARVAELRKQL